MYSPTRRTAIVVVSAKQTNALTPPPMFQALAMAVYGTNIGFELTPAQALTPSYTSAAVVRVYSPVGNWSIADLSRSLQNARARRRFSR